MTTLANLLQILPASARVFLCALALSSTSALAQPITFFDNGEVNETAGTFSNAVFVVDASPFPNSGTTLIVNPGAMFNGDFNDASLLGFENSVIIVNGGTFAQDIGLLDDTFATINGGIIGDDLVALGNATLIMNGGSVTEDLEALQGSYIEVNGGTFNEDIEAFGDARILITGGTMGDRIRTFDDGEITIRGTDFSLDGTPIVITEGIEFNGTGTLAGILSDGTPFSTEIETEDFSGDNFITIVPEPATGLLLLLGGATLAFRRRKR